MTPVTTFESGRCVANKWRDGRTQLHFLADRLLERYRELCAEERREPQEGKARYKDLKRAMLGIDEGFLRSVLLYAETGDEDLRDDIASWLMGESDETHPELLGVRNGSCSLFSNWPEKNGSGALAPSPGVSD